MKFLNKKQVQEILGKSERTIDRWRNSQKMRYPLPSVKINGSVLFPEDQFKEWVYKYQNKIA
jgi:predicted DNA-binding transcriptional regulator AlpA